MLKKLLIPCIGIVAFLALSGVVLAGVPCSGTSVWTVTTTSAACSFAGGGFCPAGDMDIVTVAVRVKDCYGNILTGETVQFQPDTPGLTFAAAESSQTDVTDINGDASVTYQFFGGCGNLKFIGISMGVTLGPTTPIYVASVDNNGSGAVDAVDFSTFAAAYGGTDPCHDYNCSGQVDGVDFSIFAAHYGH